MMRANNLSAKLQWLERTLKVKYAAYICFTCVLHTFYNNSNVHIQQQRQEKEESQKREDGTTDDTEGSDPESTDTENPDPPLRHFRTVSTPSRVAVPESPKEHSDPPKVDFRFLFPKLQPAFGLYMHAAGMLEVFFRH